MYIITDFLPILLSYRTDYFINNKIKFRSEYKTPFYITTSPVSLFYIFNACLLVCAEPGAVG